MNEIWMFITDHKIEISVVVITFICTIALIMFTTHSCVKSINEAGGFRTLIVESGKEARLLVNDIDEAVEKHYESERNIP